MLPIASVVAVDELRRVELTRKRNDGPNRHPKVHRRRRRKASRMANGASLE